MHIADLLSRNPHHQSLSMKELSILLTVTITKTDIIDIKQETMSDPILNKLNEYYNIGWPNEKKVDSNLLLFCTIKSEISIEDSIVNYKEKKLIPLSLRPFILKLLHEGHF